MVKYLAQYVPHKSDITSPFRTLLKKVIQWQWLHEHEKAVENIRSALAHSQVLGYYDVKKQVIIQADSSQSGLGACLFQGGQLIACASRALSDAESNYASDAQFHQYIYGKPVNVQSDHRPRGNIPKGTWSHFTTNTTDVTKAAVVPAISTLQPEEANVRRRHTVLRLFPSQSDSKEQDFSDDMEVMVHSMVKEIDINATLPDLPLTAIGTYNIREVTSTDPAEKRDLNGMATAQIKCGS